MSDVGAIQARHITVQYYALLREQAGRREEALATAARTPRELYAELAGRYPFTLAPRNAARRDQRRVRRLVDTARRRAMRWCSFRRSPAADGACQRHFASAARRIETRALRAQLADPACGGYAAFEGWVRDHNEGAARAAPGVRGLRGARGARRRAHPRRGHRALRRRARRAACTASGSSRSGELAVWVGVSAPHRDEAFRACRYIIDEVKHRLPIWKKEHYLSGDSGWVNCERCAAGAGAATTARAPAARLSRKRLARTLHGRTCPRRAPRTCSW